ncbi:sigma-70 family RNA polymerase sigma factor [Dysgonomonas sp. 216]|uniref:RNA polymerase sigma factor n=1 Tax=Dysgonomonas sp. 216 TaxID=2302934 RepID=UPI0013D78ACC|nr:sigma-70 family RNA polymerase sigma factor [Dysgonomonas sp. 216]NDW17883.1 sigma-70 family RNA polymerase sigma factor [Dysgonomonas sp. 216]
MDELQLISGCKQGKREYQKYLYEKYSRSMYGICMRYCSDPEAAQDLLHDGFIKIFSVIGSFSEKGSFEGWMKRIFINMALENIRKEKGHLATEDIENVADIADNIDSDADRISEDELLNMIQELPHGYKTVFNLYAIENLSHKEIAQMLGIAEGTSRSQYIRARQLLQEKILEYQRKNR